MILVITYDPTQDLIDYMESLREEDIYRSIEDYANALPTERCPICNKEFEQIDSPYVTPKQRMYTHLIDRHPDQIKITIIEPNESVFWFNNEDS